MTNKEIYKMVKESMISEPHKWYDDTHNVFCESLGLKFWTSNGISFFELSSMGFLDFHHYLNMSITHPEYDRAKGSRECEIKLSVLQTINLHIIYLRKIKKYPYLFILLRYILIGVLTLGISSFVSPLIIWATNHSNSKNVDLELSKSVIREQRFKKLLDKK